MAGEMDVDVERDMTTGGQPPLSPEGSRHCPIAIQPSNGKAILINVAIKEVNGRLVLNSAREQVSRALAESWYHRLAGRLLMIVIVGTAQVVKFESQTSASTSRESSPPPPRLFIQDFIPDPLLTEALHNPHLLFHPGCPPHNSIHKFSPQQPITAKPAARQPPQFNNPDNHAVIVIKRVLDKTKTAWLLISLLLLSPTLGLIVGICSHNAEVGIAISAGLFALATFVQGFVVWVQG